MDTDERDENSEMPSEWESGSAAGPSETPIDAEPVTLGESSTFSEETSDAGSGPSNQETIATAALPEGSHAPAASAADTDDNDRLMAALAWLSMAILQLPVISIVLLLADGNKSRHFQRYHAINSIVFWVTAVLYEVVAAVAFAILVTISLGCLSVCLWVLFFLPHLVAIYYAFLAYGGKEINIPVISAFVRNQKWA